jgi:hypothetical protein
MNSNKYTNGTIIKNLTIIHGALLLGQLMIIGVLLFLNQTNLNQPFFGDNKILIVIMPVVVAGGFYLSRYLFLNKMEAAKNMPTIDEKINEYLGASMVQYALLEGPSILSAILFFLTGGFYFLLGSFAMIICFVLIRPSKQKAINDLGLFGDEVYAFDDN